MNDRNTVLSGKVAFVTGAGSGIGAAIAARFAEAGAKIAIGAAGFVINRPPVAYLDQAPLKDTTMTDFQQIP